MYKTVYLPVALADLESIIRYISNNLEAPRAAERLRIKIDKGIEKIGKNPFRCHRFQSKKQLKNEYRILHVNNYSLFYTVEENTITVQRIIYSRRDIDSMLEGLGK